MRRVIGPALVGILVLVSLDATPRGVVAQEQEPPDRTLVVVTAFEPPLLDPQQVFDLGMPTLSCCLTRALMGRTGSVRTKGATSRSRTSRRGTRRSRVTA